MCVRTVVLNEKSRADLCLHHSRVRGVKIEAISKPPNHPWVVHEASWLDISKCFLNVLAQSVSKPNPLTISD